MKKNGLPIKLAALIAVALLQAPIYPQASQEATGVTSGPQAEQTRLQPGDKLLYAVLEDPNRGPALEEVMVNSRFDINFTVSRGFGQMVSVNTRDKSLSAIRGELKAKLDEEYYHNATVELRLKEQTARQGKVLMHGSVRNNFVTLTPGEPKGLLEVVLQSGPTEFANLKKVKLTRIDPTTGKLEITNVNVEDIKKDPTKDIHVRDEDIIEIPERKIVF